MKNTFKKHLSPHFILYEFVRSGTADDNDIDNTPTARHIDNLTSLCANILEPLRRRFGPIVISSGYRCQRLNKLVGGVSTSQHCLGQAADIVVGDKERAQRLAAFIKANLDFDQLILDPAPRWLHVSYRRKEKNRHQVL